MQLILAIKAFSSLEKLGNTNNYVNLYARAMLKKWLQEQMHFFAGEEMKLAEKYGTLKADGTIVFNDDKEQAQKNAQLFFEEKQKLEQVEVDPPAKFTITNADLCGTALSAETVIDLEPFIDFEFMKK